MNPENASKGGGGAFKEGFIRIDGNTYKVHQAQGEDAVPATKWIWDVTRLQQDGETPLVDEHEEVVREQLFFSFGGKCLPFVHPGKADSVNDEEPEDLGVSVGAEGNTIFLNAPDWRPNEKSGLMILTGSMAKQGVDRQFLDRCWTPDWNGCIFEMASQLEKGRDGREFSYKIVKKVVVGPGGGKKAAKTNSKAAANSSPNGEVEPALVGVIMAMSEEMDGQQLTRKAFVNRVRVALDEKKVDSKLIIPALNLAKSDDWLRKNAETLDISVSENAVLFGALKDA